ncbi:ABC transporter ATP-binding protein [Pontibacter arcticus]|uniref:ABC transporter ATP-binding protein n=1 Tax=Pontibacter arcticus TaxID=2080288 RepID=A0A364RGI6_9BACT|nr:ABC transporter ATP-binding protein [Pontibacter arcticus]RAU83296.1 hypothetical protein DP923_08800 [Pontibacter arcticus]
MSRNIIFSTIQRIYNILPPSFRKQSLWVMVLLFLNSILELLGLAAIFPIITIMLQENAVTESKYLSMAYNILGFTSIKAFIVSLAVFVLVFIILKNIASLLIIRKQASYTLSLYKYFSSHLFSYYYRKGFLFFKSNNPNKITRNINSIPSEFSNSLVSNLLNFINELLILILIVIGILLYDPLVIVLLLVFVVPIFGILYRSVKNKASSIQNELNELNPKIGKNMFQSIYGYVDVQMTNTELYFKKIHDTYLHRATLLKAKDKVIQQAPTKVIESAMIAAIVLVALYGTLFLENQSHLTGLLTIFALAAYRVLPSVNRLMIALIGIKGYQYTLEVITQINQEEVKEAAVPVSEQIIPFQNEIKISDLSFAYDNKKPVLQHINLSIPIGASIGIIGRSGSGKSTLINILLGFLYPKEGYISVDDTVVTPDNLQSFRKLIGYVQQDVYVLDATIAENVAFGIPASEIDLSKVEHALKSASMLTFASQLPNGIHTRIGDRGSLLSGGQKQRIGIARAIYSGAKILVFDEATSALDTQTEIEITESIKALSEENITMLIIAHRYTTLKYCNAIIELENGLVKQVHSYDSLSEKALSS